MAGLLMVKRHGESMGGSPALSSTSSLMRQPSAEDLDAAHQLVSSARGRPDAAVAHDLIEGIESRPSTRPESEESRSMRKGIGKGSAGNVRNLSTRNPPQDSSAPAKGGAPSGQTCRFVLTSSSHKRVQ
jgi:hypothetical protein